MIGSNKSTIFCGDPPRYLKKRIEEKGGFFQNNLAREYVMQSRLPEGGTLLLHKREEMRQERQRGKLFPWDTIQEGWGTEFVSTESSGKMEFTNDQLGSKEEAENKYLTMR